MLLSHALSSSRYHLHMVCAMPLLASPSLLHRASVEAYPQVCLGLCPSAPSLDLCQYQNRSGRAGQKTKD
jgi:hypothetical protein